MSKFANKREEFEMAFVINLIDGTGREFFINKDSQAVAYDDSSPHAPLVLKTTDKVNKYLASLHRTFPTTCRLIVVDTAEFENRRLKAVGKHPD